MQIKFDKRDRADLFRTRLAQAMATRTMSQSALARGVGADRSTISQLLSSDGPRLPNAQIVAECASALGVSADWLLGLTERPESAADLMAINLSITEAPRALVDEQIFAWHKEAAGFKIRHVPAALPDMLKLREVLEWEYEPHLGRTSAQAIRASEDRLALLLNLHSDYEIAVSLHEIECFARAHGYYSDLPRDLRAAQLDRLIELYDQLFPTLRLHIFDARRTYSSPITVFGPLLAVFYVGRYYIAFRDSERVQAFTTHFDGLVRQAAVPDRDIIPYLQGLRDAL
ncbi:helix-turn-helix domain-containing protein [Anianabacter salinae]|uniref:helix-turn-helix domain-containing protein n=1 Tax=Anianabacter salinae TaxID=2851023 RepID=UPI00225DFB2E|nr:helix-turn-helix domain-containing protein [Anianabacter salinae]MBV0911402.1 helix-turn-helix domain-containing protein [Anianabacter salinae]